EARRRIEQELAGRPRGERRWYVTKQGHTMAVFPGPAEFQMGSPAGERDRGDGEELHQERIPYLFAIATKEVTVGQFRAFLKDHPDISKRLGRSLEKYGPDESVVGVTWPEAAAYCNWLSKQEGIPEDGWCYLPNDKGEYAEGMKMAANWQNRSG